MGDKKSKVIDKSFLLELGMKEALLEKLNDKQLDGILLYAAENQKVENILNSLIQLASMEIRGKEGAAFLVAHKIATISQLKNLAPEQIEEVIDELYTSNDHDLAAKSIKRHIVLNQQEKLYVKSGGVHGEFYIDQSANIQNVNKEK